MFLDQESLLLFSIFVCLVPGRHESFQFARQYIQTMPKPKAKQIDNLPAAIAVKRRQGANNRSTVGTLTELTDFIQTLYYQSAELVCPSCSKILYLTQLIAS